MLTVDYYISDLPSSHPVDEAGYPTRPGYNQYTEASLKFRFNTSAAQRGRGWAGGRSRMSYPTRV